MPLFILQLGESVMKGSSPEHSENWDVISGMEKKEREETPLQGEDESRRSSPP